MRVRLPLPGVPEREQKLVRCLTPNVLDLLRAAHQAGPQSDIHPALADALEEAGWDDGGDLMHLRLNYHLAVVAECVIVGRLVAVARRHGLWN